MPHYIRFLKPPRVVSVAGDRKSKAARAVTALITITTDLGDAFLAEDVDVIGTLHVDAGNGKACSFRKEARWKETDRELTIAIPVPAAGITARTAQLSVRAAGFAEHPADPVASCRIVSAWSGPLAWQEGAQAERLVQRRLDVGTAPELRIWEETGNSIARHIWDAALACVMGIHRSVTGRGDSGTVPALRALVDDRDGRSRRSVIELGTGCGIVGIALAQMVPRCSVYLTDLEEARPMVRRNVECATLAPGSTVQFDVLDWDEELRADVRGRHHDLVVVSDCTYNADRMPSLVRTLQALGRSSPRGWVLVALKRRHDSEAVFFTLMAAAGFRVHGNPATLLDDGRIETYCFCLDAS
ncbi:hypothetical protein VTO42DRAFT_4900 [Malbranchea cinnamomea]